MKKVLVTGGAGFIGSHLCKRLRDDGHYVVVYDRKMPEFELAPAHEYFVYDLRNPVDFYGSFRWSDADELYQLAAQMGGAEYIFSGENDADIMHSSAMINLNVLEAARQAQIKKVFFASSACVYPSLDGYRQWTDAAMTESILRFSHPDCKEDDAGDPDSSYGWEKLFAEKLYLAYAKNHGMQVRIGRFHNIYGAYGTWKGGREKAPAAFMRKIAELPNSGGRIECFGDGEQTRSFLHVSEAVEGVVRLMASDFAGPVNVGSSEMVSINMLAQVIGEIADKTFGIQYRDGPLGVRGRNSNNDLIEQHLGWKPSMSLRDGLEMTYPWIKAQVDKQHAIK